MSEHCYHCGAPLGATPVHRSLPPRAGESAATARPFCCNGCAHAAALIHEAGLDGYYRHREAPAPRPNEAGSSNAWQAWDRPAAAAHYLAPRGPLREAMLQIDGLRCAACGWLIASRLRQLPGVQEATIHPTTGRGLVIFDPAQLRFSELLAAIAALGYRPQPTLGAPDDADPEGRALLRRLLVAGLGMMQVMTYAVALYAGALQGIDPNYRQFLALVSLLVATPVLLYSGGPFLRGALHALLARRLNADVPIALALLGGWLLSTVNAWRGSGEIYFESITMFVFLLTAARWLEHRLRRRSNDAVAALARLLPATCRRLGPDGAGEAILLQELAAGDRVQVAQGEAIPADGVIERGAGQLDEALLTGESRLQPRGPGATAVGGSVNHGEPLIVRITATGAASHLGRLSRLLLRAQTSRPAAVAAAERLAQAFVAGILLAAGAALALWWPAGPGRALEVALTVLVVSCPCAFSLATPAAYVAASTRLLRQGILVLRPGALERVETLDTLVIDKTGTLTCGAPHLQAIHPLAALPAARCLQLAGALETHSRHPLAQALVTAAAAQGLTMPAAQAVRERAGQGVSGEVDGLSLRLGRPPAAMALPPLPPGATPVLLQDANQPLAVFVLADPLRAEAPAVIASLRAAGIRPLLASGDVPEAVAAAASAAGITEHVGGLTPAGKLARLQAEQRRGHRLAAIGDGNNDAPLLAAAQVSLVMGAGTALAQSQADFVLPAGTLAPLPEVFATARRARRLLRQNLGWAIGYNLCALPLALAGTLTPYWAALGMTVSSLLVVLNAARLARVPAAAGPAPMADPAAPATPSAGGPAPLKAA